MKRPCDDSSSGDSEPEESIDVGSESLYPGHLKASFITYGSPSTTTAPQVTARKRRRGIIEKRRRDRINNSLLELRRLVPTAVEKQGSAKLEKAEILQMTVDHLKMMQITGGKGYLDVHALALDFLSVGFRECVSEVSRFLSVVEGLDGGDPLPSRLLSHLASCASQRHAASFAAAAAASHSPHHHHHHHHLHQQHHHLHHHQQQQQPPPPIHPHHWAAAAAAVATAAAFRPLPPATAAGTPFGRGAASDGGAPTPDSSSSSSSSSSLLLPCGPAPLSASLLSLSASLHSFPVALHAGLPLLPAFPSPAAAAAATSPASSSSSSSSQTPPSSSQRAYRPWGAEVGAF